MHERGREKRDEYLFLQKKKLLSSKSWEIQRSRCFILQLHKSEKDGKTKHKRKIIGFQYVPVACLESYRSHRGYCGSCKIWKIATKLFAILFYQFQDNYFDFFSVLLVVSKTPARKKPPIPAPDFEKEFHHLWQSWETSVERMQTEL